MQTIAPLLSVSILFILWDVVPRAQFGI